MFEVLIVLAALGVEPDRSPLLDLPVAVPQDCIKYLCFQGTGCCGEPPWCQEIDEHRTEESSQALGRQKGNLHLTCWTAGGETGCDTFHPRCSPDPEDEDAVELAALRVNALREVMRVDADVSTLLNKYATVLTVNRARGAIQLKGCGDSILANIPLTQAQLKSLE